MFRVAQAGLGVALEDLVRAAELRERVDQLGARRKSAQERDRFGRQLCPALVREEVQHGGEPAHRAGCSRRIAVGPEGRNRLLERIASLRNSSGVLGGLAKTAQRRRSFPDGRAGSARARARSSSMRRRCRGRAHAPRRESGNGVRSRPAPQPGRAGLRLSSDRARSNSGERAHRRSPRRDRRPSSPSTTAAATCRETRAARGSCE